jgi:prepilin-type N-terminal cleavage/methylation domain-containing protein
MKSMPSAKAFTLAEIMIVVAVIGIVSAIALPSFVRARAMANRGACLANMNRIRDAVAIWALDTNATDGATPQLSDLTPTYIRTWPACQGAAYALPAVGTNPACPNNISDHVLPEGNG